MVHLRDAFHAIRKPREVLRAPVNCFLGTVDVTPRGGGGIVAGDRVRQRGGRVVRVRRVQEGLQIRIFPVVPRLQRGHPIGVPRLARQRLGRQRIGVGCAVIWGLAWGLVRQPTVAYKRLRGASSQRRYQRSQRSDRTSPSLHTHTNQRSLCTRASGDKHADSLYRSATAVT